MRLIFLFVAVFFIAPLCTEAAEPAFSDTVFKAEVIDINESGIEAVEGTELSSPFQNITVRITEGPKEGEVLDVQNTSSLLLSVGESFYLHYVPATTERGEQWSVGEPDRAPVLLILLFAFILITALAGGWAGVRALIALATSFAVILFALVPALAAGAPPVLTAVLLSVAMLVVSMVITHGWRPTTLVALVGSIFALMLAAGIAEAAVTLAHLSGFVSDEVVFLNLSTKGALDISGLLLGGILIGIVGVLNDISVSQVHTVAALKSANPNLSRQELLIKAMHVGREHIGAVVNTLPLAYAGAALPLLMIFAASEAPFSFIVNREVFSAEIIRIAAGGIALALSGVVATLLAAFYAKHLEGPRDTIGHRH